jgi:hypothetical protein
MPLVDFIDAELEALYAVHTSAAKVDWSAYDRARQRIVAAGHTHLKSNGCEVTDALAVSHEPLEAS